MKKANVSVKQCRLAVNALVGKSVTVKCNRGRNKFCVFDGVISEAYPAVFIIKTDDATEGRRSFSYQDILCGNVRIRERREPV